MLIRLCAKMCAYTLKEMQSLISSKVKECQLERKSIWDFSCFMFKNYTMRNSPYYEGSEGLRYFHPLLRKTRVLPLVSFLITHWHLVELFNKKENIQIKVISCFYHFQTRIFCSTKEHNNEQCFLIFSTEGPMTWDHLILT